MRLGEERGGGKFQGYLGTKVTRLVMKSLTYGCSFQPSAPHTGKTLWKPTPCAPCQPVPSLSTGVTYEQTDACGSFSLSSHKAFAG